MPIQRTSVEAYLKDGCGRCEHYQTPQCKVLLWTEPLQALRKLVLAAGLQETLKWGSPCYTHDGRNVVMVVSFREYCSIEFFQGAALEAEEGVLESHGENSHVARFVRFHSAKEVRARKALLEGLLAQAIERAKAGEKIERPKAAQPVPAELARRLASDAPLRKAFEALTPGRRRSHVLHVSGAKQSTTREARVAKCVPVILAGRGFNER